MALGGAYDGLAEGWDSAAGRVYRPLAQALVKSSPVALAGLRVLDVGSGTGAVAEAAELAGATVLATDRSVDMVSFQSRSRQAAVADAVDLPFPNQSFDAVTAGFLLNHLSASKALAEMGRTVRAGGFVLASTWAAGRPDHVKSAVDEVIGRWGWQAPEWFLDMKARIEPISGDPDALGKAARGAGLTEVRATVHAADLGLRPDVVVAYRLTLPQIAPWVTGLTPTERAELSRQSATAVAEHIDTWRPSVILLSARKA